jgi:hypothetical protein
MAGAGGSPMLRSVEHRNITLALELRLADDALTGRVTAADGKETDFSGWLGLVATIEALLAEPSDDTPTLTEEAAA